MIVKYVVQTQVLDQISEDRWEVVPRSLEIDDNTTIHEIRLWLQEVHSDKYDPIEFHVTQLEKLYS